MNLKEIKDLIDFLIAKDIAEFELERGDVKVRVKRNSEAPERVVHVAAETAQGWAAPAPPVAAAASPAASAAPSFHPPAHETEAGLHEIKSPIVGTFYESPSPGAPPFVKPGDGITAGQVLCIIEAMKLMNEIESDVAGEIVKKLVSNGQPVEYGQPLFLVRPGA